jgi:chromosome segregation ATPase
MTETETLPPEEETKKHRNPWIWVSAALGVVAVGLLVWALATRSDLNDTQNQVDSLESQVQQGQETGSQVVTAAKGTIDDLTQQLGATSDDLANAEQDVKDAQATADQAQKDADAAKQQADKANDATEKAQAEADQAKADQKAAESKASIAADCAKAYVAAIGTIFEGDDIQAQAAKVSEQMKGITSECQAALAGT